VDPTVGIAGLGSVFDAEPERLAARARDAEVEPLIVIAAGIGADREPDLRRRFGGDDLDVAGVEDAADLHRLYGTSGVPPAATARRRVSLRGPAPRARAGPR